MVHLTPSARPDALTLSTWQLGQGRHLARSKAAMAEPAPVAREDPGARGNTLKLGALSSSAATLSKLTGGCRDSARFDKPVARSSGARGKASDGKKRDSGGKVQSTLDLISLKRVA